MRRIEVNRTCLLTLVLTFVFALGTAGHPAMAGESPIIDIDVKDKPLHEVVRFIREAAGASILLGENRDGRPIAGDDTLRVTLKLHDVAWETALKLAVEKAGARVERLAHGGWRVFQPPRYTLSLVEADLGVVVTLIARLGDLNVIFNSDLLRGRRITMRLSDLPWNKVLEVVVKAAGLVLVPDREGGKRRIAMPDGRISTGSSRSATTHETNREARPSGRMPEGGETVHVPELRVSSILWRRDGGKSKAIVNGVLVNEGDRVSLEAVQGPPGTVKKVILEKIESDRFVWFRAGGARLKVPVEPAAGKESGR